MHSFFILHNIIIINVIIITFNLIALLLQVSRVLVLGYYTSGGTEKHKSPSSFPFLPRPGLRHTQRVSSSIIIRLKAGQDAESPQEQEPSREESIALNKLCNQVVKSILNASDEGIDKAKAAVIEVKA